MLRYGLALLALLSVTLLAPACGSSQPACTGNLHPYKNKCLSNTPIEYVGCTEGRGVNTTRELGAGIGGTFKVVANASLNLAYKKSQQEDTPVALQIVKDCMEIAKSSGSAAERSIAAAFQQRADQYLQQWQDKQVEQTPHIALSPTSGKIGDQVTVSGSHFWKGELVDIRFNADLVRQVNADGSGAFSEVITIPSSAPSSNFSSEILATGQSSAKTAEAPFHIAP